MGVPPVIIHFRLGFSIIKHHTSMAMETPMWMYAREAEGLVISSSHLISEGYHGDTKASFNGLIII